MRFLRKITCAITLEGSKEGETAKGLQLETAGQALSSQQPFSQGASFFLQHLNVRHPRSLYPSVETCYTERIRQASEGKVHAKRMVLS